MSATVIAIHTPSALQGTLAVAVQIVDDLLQQIQTGALIYEVSASGVETAEVKKVEAQKASVV